ncbi:undecaprenyl-diphosphate phosphatase [bacterium]|nr:undecaprenyl-diphosphate phosphatase [bacterium]
MLCFYLLMCVQIVLESFPVSSSGHVALLEKMIKILCANNLLGESCMYTYSQKIINSEFIQHFLHGPTIFILLLFFFSRWSFLFVHFRSCWKICFKLIGLAAISGTVTACFYMFFKIVNPQLFPLWLGFFISGFALFSLWYKKDITYSVFTWRKALLLGLVQGIAFLPGISRFALTYVVARWINLSPKKSFEISFVIQWPLLFAAFCKTIVYGVVYNRFQDVLFLCSWQSVIVLLSASVGAFFALGFAQKLLYKKRGFIFSLYLVIPFFLSLFI